jgi:hypothetical protein
MITIYTHIGNMIMYKYISPIVMYQFSELSKAVLEYDF